jgi:predicted AAA+ superfamily ATPase
VDSPEGLAVNSKLGSVFETWAVNYVHQQFATLAIPPSTYHWRTSGGAEVDLIIEKNGKLYPLEMKCKTNLTKIDLTGLKAFRETYDKKDIMPGLIIYAGSEPYQLDENTLAIPWNLI